MGTTQGNADGVASGIEKDLVKPTVQEVPQVGRAHKNTEYLNLFWVHSD